DLRRARQSGGGRRGPPRRHRPRGESPVDRRRRRFPQGAARGRERQERAAARASRRQHHLPRAEAAGLSRRSAVTLSIARAVAAPAIGWAALPGYERWVALDRTVVEKFSGRPWAVPSRVYAEPFVVYPGMQLATDDLLRRLHRVGYRDV